MSKAILMSIKPKYVSMILNKVKTVEVRKRFPSDYVGWVYIYCTQEKNYHDILIKHAMDGVYRVGNCFGTDNGKEHNEPLNRKVVARFWVDKVEDYVNGVKWSWKKGAPMWGVDAGHEKILKPSCLTEDELYDYCEDLAFNAIYITKLEIFDKPKELNEFFGYTDKKVERYAGLPKVKVLTSLKKAPQSRQYIEVEE